MEMVQPENQTDLSKFIKESKTDKLSSSRLLVLAWGLGTLIVWIVTSVISALNGGRARATPRINRNCVGYFSGRKNTAKIW